MRKISRTLALMSLLAPLGANALGIGDIRLHSALNQSLNAEIPLVTSGGDELSEIRVTLASPEAFARAGIERHYSLSKLRFTPQQKADGSYVIKVSSQDSIREPFLNFMIDVHWPQGRLQREFTVLLDPPASFDTGTAEAAELPEVEPYRRLPEPTISQPRRDMAPPIAGRPPKPARERKASAEPAQQAPAEKPAVTGTQYGPISKNETLWGIAKRFSQDTAISQEKMLTALYRANPQAFRRNDINALKSGETIIIPDQESVARLVGAPSAPQALRNGRKLAAKEEFPSAGEQGAQGQLKLLAPSAGKPREEATTPGPKGKGGKPREEAEPGVAVDNTARQENEEIRKRLADLEQQLSTMQRLLSLKNEEIATIQAQQKQAAKQVPQPPTAPVQPAVPHPPETQPAAKAPPSVAEPAKEPPRAIPTAPPSAQEVPAVAPTAGKPSPTGVTPVTPPFAQQPAVTPSPTPPPKPLVKPTAPPPEEGVLAKLLGHPLYLLGGMIGLLALVVWGVKRKRTSMPDDTESILTLSDREKTLQAKRPTLSIDPVISGMSEHSTAARSSFLSEFTPSDFDALGGEMEEVDPISEADVYLAYGRYKQAEELIRSAIAQNPERDECTLKLLEIHYATENAQAFEKFAEELEPTHRLAKPEFWEKVVEMGLELCPDSPLFSDAGGTTPDFDHHHRPGPSDTPEWKTGAEEDTQIPDFSLQTSKPAGNRQKPPAQESQPTIAYDFFATEAAAKPSLEKDERDSLQIDNIVSLEKTQTKATGLQDDKSLDEILAELGVFDESEAAQAIPEAPGKKDGGGGKKFDLELELAQEPPPATEDKPFGEDATDYMGLTEMDEQETKLDLAKAYFDMGDDEAARIILEDVAQQGNETQKEEAWSLLNRLNRKEVNRR